MKKILIFILSIFLLSGCNIYRQMVIPTPYYPKQNQVNSNILGEEVNEVTLQENNSLETNQEVKTKITPVSNNSININKKTFVQRIPFPVDEYNSLEKNGKATIKGKIYAILANGQKVYSKHTRLYLNPVTSYSTQWYKESYLGGAKMSKVDPRLFNYLKFTTSDNNGNFEFLNVPSGSYYLIGVIKCANECGYNQTKNIRVAKKINVFGDEIKEVDLSKRL